MTDLAVVIPSRGRPWQAAHLVERVWQTTTGDPRVVVSVDTSDPELSGYKALASEWPYGSFLYCHGGTGHVNAINAGAAVGLEFGARVIAKLDDDHWPLTEGWDAVLLAALDELGGTGIVYGDDLLQGESLPTAPVVSADIVRTLGWMGPGELQHLYVDNFWRDLGRDAGCLRYVPEVVIEHRHALVGKAPVDEGYLHANAPSQYERDGEAYRRWLKDPLGHAAAVAKVRALKALA